MSQLSTTPLSFDLQLALPFQTALTAVRDALKAEGFGILTEIDLQAAFREKLGKAFRDFRILGACNPPLAYEAVSTDPSVALLLPCNVTVEAEAGGTTRIRFTNPEALLAASPEAPRLAVVAQDARRRLERAYHALQASTT
jgi:uncharacterized protein (DUF302 family)